MVGQVEREVNPPNLNRAPKKMTVPNRRGDGFRKKSIFNALEASEDSGGVME
jgi:hypothetical protein